MSQPEQTNDRSGITRTLDILFADERVIGEGFSDLPWWKTALVLGFIWALAQLLLAYNPSVCYLKAIEQVKGIEVTLPEAMSEVKSWAWFNLLLTPPLLLLSLGIGGWLATKVSGWFKGEGGFKEHFAAVVVVAGLLMAGNFLGYLLVASVDLKRLVDLRDLTPGIGLGLFPYFSLERMGRFWWEVVRGIDLFGVAAVLLSTRLLGSINRYRRSTAFGLSFAYYAIYIFLRWLFEGPGHQFWVYFWTSGSV